MPARASRSRAACGWLATMPSRSPRSLQAAQQAVDFGPQLEDVEIARHGAHALADAVDRARIAAAQRLDHVAIGVGREGRDRCLRRLVDHRLVDADAFQPAGRGDGAVDRDFPGELQVDGAADVEQDCAIGHRYRGLR